MRERAYSIVFETLENEKYSDALLHAMFRAENLLDRDKKFIKRLAYGTIERGIELDFRINCFSKIPVKKMHPVVRTVLRMAVYEIYYMEQIPEGVSCHEAVELVKKKGGNKFSGFVNGILRNMIREQKDIVLKEDWVRFSLPKELMTHLQDSYGKKTAAKIAEAFLVREGKVTLHIDKNKIAKNAYIDLLEKNDIAWKEAVYADDAVVLERVSDIASLPGYREGYFFVQDESSMLPVMCSGIKPGDTVVDICSAPGGKTMHALILLGGEGTISSRDVSRKKVDKIKENIARMGYSNCQCKVWDATVKDEAWKEQADVILADVPCSGIGIIGRKPEIKYHAMEEMESLVSLQRQICETAVSMLKPNGVFIYSTCTINKKENEENVLWLEKHCGLQRSSLNDYLPQKLHNKMTERGMLQMLPGVQETDGFFVARLIKRG